MPTNLNALIRYKQIDRDLNNPYLKTTIKSLQESCSNQLAEHRGVYKLISERTIRDDIRVMRSDALGFNAPIIVKDGVYSYVEKDYSIFDIEMNQYELLKDIRSILINEKDNIKNPNLYLLVARINEIIGVENNILEVESHGIMPLDDAIPSLDGGLPSSYDYKQSDGFKLSKETREKLIKSLKRPFGSKKFSDDKKPLSLFELEQFLNSEKPDIISWNSIFELF